MLKVMNQLTIFVSKSALSFPFDLPPLCNPLQLLFSVLVGAAAAERKTYSGEEACGLEDGLYEWYDLHLLHNQSVKSCANKSILLWQAVDERQEDAISGALKQLNEKKNHIEENMRLANELKVWCYCTFQECMLKPLYDISIFATTTTNMLSHPGGPFYKGLGVACNWLFITVLNTAL